MCRLLARWRNQIKFPPTGRIGKLLVADEANTRVSPALMAALDPWAVEAFEETAEVFRKLFRRIETWTAEDAEDVKLREFAKTMGLSEQQLIQRLLTAPHEEPADVQVAWFRLGAFRVVKMLVLACHRYWLWAATDLARLRITPAVGYLRLEAESVGLAKLFLDEPELAERWMQTRTPKDGKEFFANTQSRLKTVLQGFQLGKTYDIASGTGLHLRMASIVRSLSSRGGQLRLPDQDFDPEDAFSFHHEVAYFHRIQSRVLAAFGTILPGLADIGWNKVVGAYSARVDGLWNLLETKYPDRVKEFGSGE